ncbi:hypothetical protein FG167_08755 [Lacinutrix sp. WUR7]|uniref:hypothetical protein n=1 Tax=Lacinutrix sp. WUR7 TaxID=2653681 RepID=UPI00193CDADF|nr:hypothetical protein [Lacinutrix sp. WUR7]QRM89319.1 hypothetical protein FG167_08755 [Lacinutrix sp. WUR7]
MEYEYFGITDEKKFLELNDKERLDYFINNNIFKQSYALNFNGIPEPSQTGKISLNMELSQDHLEYSFVKEIGAEIYHFLLKSYKLYLGANVVFFQRDFESEIYGLNNDDKRKKGLYYFNEFYKKFGNNLNSKMHFNSKGKRELEARFATLKREQKALESLLLNDFDLVCNFLLGVQGYFNKELYENNELIKQLFYFENNLQILLYLNNTFKYEENEWFSENSISQKIYKDNEQGFASKKVVEFIEFVFSNPLNRKRNFGLAVFHSMKELELINCSAKQFKELCNTNFKCEFKNLQLGNPSNSHLKKVENFKKQWGEFEN